MIPKKYYWLFAMVGAQGLLMVVSNILPLLWEKIKQPPSAGGR